MREKLQDNIVTVPVLDMHTRIYFEMLTLSIYLINVISLLIIAKPSTAVWMLRIVLTFLFSFLAYCHISQYWCCMCRKQRIPVAKEWEIKNKQTNWWWCDGRDKGISRQEKCVLEEPSSVMPCWAAARLLLSSLSYVTCCSLEVFLSMNVTHSFAKTKASVKERKTYLSALEIP